MLKTFPAFAMAVPDRSFLFRTLTSDTVPRTIPTIGIQSAKITLTIPSTSNEMPVSFPVLSDADFSHVSPLLSSNIILRLIYTYEP